MKLHEKIKYIREDRKLSQEFIAHELGLSQSQYSRREKGETKFMAEEIIKISNALQTKISELYGEESVTFTINNQSGRVAGYIEQYNAVSDKLLEQYEKRIAEKDEIIQMLKNQLAK
jgi:transcriptional regulator with XRE-family HTH domain